MLRLLSLAFCVPFLLIAVSAIDKDAAKAPEGCSVNNYNNNYYAGPQKKVESLLAEIKQELGELKVQVANLMKCNNGEGAKKCQSNSCQNNGTCNEYAKGFNCSCPLGFAGDRCQDDFSSTLSQFLVPAVGKDPKWKLCYRASIDGWKADTFHNRCDGKYHTVTIIKKGPFIFGGYTDIPWGQARAYCATPKAFIFSLRNKEGLPPFKSTARYPGRHSVGCFPGFGPTFGHGHDIYIADNANSNTASYTNFGYHKDFNVPSGVQDKRTVLAGTYYFTPVEVEVFYLD